MSSGEHRGELINDRYRVSRVLRRTSATEILDASLEAAAQIRRAVILERLIAPAGPPETARFFAEAQRASWLRHPNIVTVLDLGVDRGRPFLVSEPLEGLDLHGIVAFG